MKKIIWLALVSWLSLCVFSQNERRPVFRKAFWGMKKIEIKKTEGTAPILENGNPKNSGKLTDYYQINETDQDEYLVFEDKLFDFPGAVIYKFINGKFYRGVFRFVAPEELKISEIYDAIKKKYLAQYGRPARDAYKMISWDLGDKNITLSKLRSQVEITYFCPDVNAMMAQDSREKK
jgi:hypothetical protein